MCVCLCVCVCPPLRLLITHGMIWTQYDWLARATAFTWQLQSLSVVGVALELKRIV